MTMAGTSITLDGKRIKIDPKVPRGDVSWLSGKWHVSMTDAEIEADIRKRCNAPGYTPSIINQTVAYAIWCHRKNQKLYRYVARGY
jgi:hypothetical protein